MDVQHDLSQVRQSVGNDDVIRHLGFRLCQPLNTNLMSEEEVDVWWRLVQTQDYMFTDFERGNELGWKARFRDMRHLHIGLGTDGYALLLNAWCCDTPELHYCTWNKVDARRVLEAGQEVVNFAFTHMKAARVGSFIPESHRNALKLATMLGMKYEGTIRKAYLFYERSYDVQAYGILREEWNARKERLQNAKH